MSSLNSAAKSSSAVSADDTAHVMGIVKRGMQAESQYSTPIGNSLAALGDWVTAALLSLTKKMQSAAPGAPGKNREEYVRAIAIAERLVSEAKFDPIEGNEFVPIELESGVLHGAQHREMHRRHEMMIRKGIVWPSVSSIHALGVHMRNALESLGEAREAAHSTLATLLNPTLQMVQATNQCSVCRQEFGGSGPPCDLCKSDGILGGIGDMLRPSLDERKATEYQSESKLRDLQERIRKAREEGKSLEREKRSERTGANDAGDQGQALNEPGGKRVDSAFLRVLRAMLSFFHHIDAPFRIGGKEPPHQPGSIDARPMHGNDDFPAEAQSFSRSSASKLPSSPGKGKDNELPTDACPAIRALLQGLFDEHKAIRGAYSKQGDLLAAADYLEQAKQNIRLLPDGEPMPEGVLANQFVESPAVAIERAHMYERDIISAEADLRTAVSKLSHAKLLR